MGLQDLINRTTPGLFRVFGATYPLRRYGVAAGTIAGIYAAGGERPVSGVGFVSYRPSLQVADADAGRLGDGVTVEINGKRYKAYGEPIPDHAGLSLIELIEEDAG